MAALLRRLWLTVFALTIAAIVAGAVVDTESNGKLWFFLWSLLSRGWNGGDRIAVNDVTIYYETFGSGPPVPSGEWLEFAVARSPGSMKVSVQAARSIG